MIDRDSKGIGALSGDPASGAAPGWRLLRGEVALPAAVLRESRVDHNLRWMQHFVTAYGLKLAPHGKTTMAPQLFRRQIAAGAWGITLATAHQACVAAAHGVPRVLMANQLVGRANIAMIADLIASSDVEFFCLVDSPDSVAALGHVFAERDSRVQVLLEVAPTVDQSGFRTGVRDAAQLTATLAAIAQWSPHVALAGVEVYEGVLAQEDEIRVLLRRTVAIARAIVESSAAARSPLLLSGAGSAWYDVVAEEFSRADIGMPVDIVLRPGCYLSHDAGLYRKAQADILARNPVAREMHGGLLAALQIWACVQSVPSAERAVIAFGKRDAAFDAGLPMPDTYFREGRDDAPRAVPRHWTITGMMDQHAYLEIRPGDDIRVGDIIAFDISHPCLTFDKWRNILLVDDDFRCIEVVRTYF